MSWDEEGGCYRPFALDVLTLRGDKIAEVTAFITRAAELPDRESYSRWPEQALDPERVESVFERFGLPARVD